ncbi:hypothetical protein HmCmsJML203_01941 [Escherichia coli]|nr:hypothetical protein HmCmsJML203_01941 [Escherichia coli]GDE76123.1 hypothetical protein HmCmsJML281_02469 [Escherichia coli]
MLDGEKLISTIFLKWILMKRKYLSLNLEGEIYWFAKVEK